MQKHKFDMVLFNNIYQVSKNLNKVTNREFIMQRFNISDRVAGYYMFVLNNREGIFNLKEGVENVLIIGDIHLPFTLSGYLEHCVQVYHQYNCNKVMFIGDVLDNHFTSFHDVDPDGLSAKDELDIAINMVYPWYEAFPEADVCIGNHDERPRRIAFKNRISEKWIRSIDEILGTPTWNFQPEFLYNGVTYTHGMGGGGENGAYQKALNWRTSVVQGHWHTTSYIRYSVSAVDRIFALQVGCGIDRKAYAMAYARNFIKRPIISCAVVQNNGTLPILCPMHL